MFALCSPAAAAFRFRYFARGTPNTETEADAQRPLSPNRCSLTLRLKLSSPLLQMQMKSLRLSCAE
jgi:hypothetical protein